MRQSTSQGETVEPLLSYLANLCNLRNLWIPLTSGVRHLFRLNVFIEFLAREESQFHRRLA